MQHFLLQQGGKHRLGNTLVFHDVFEDRVVYRVGDMYDHDSYELCVG